MVTRKYVRDYQISESLGSNGRIKTESVYIGPDYYLVDKASAMQTARILPWLICLGWIAFVAAMIPQSGAAHQMYIILPYAFLALPLGYLSGSAMVLLRCKEPMIRSQSDKLSETYPTASLFGMIISGAALAAEGITALAAPEKMSAGDIVFAAGCAVILAVMVIIFLRRATVKTREKK